MNTVRERILIGIKPYLKFAEHRDLISFCVSSECFEDWEEVEENNGNDCADFSELIVIVDKEWLFNYMKKESQLQMKRLPIIKNLSMSRATINSYKYH